VTKTRNSKGLELKPALDTTMQTRIQESKYWKENMQKARKLFLGYGSNPNCLAFYGL
jgi:hypothetical protein